MKTLGGITLPRGLQLTQAGHSLGAGSVARLDLSGRPVIFAAPSLSRVTLTATDDMGWLTTAQVEALIALSTSASETTLSWTDDTLSKQWKVAFDHERGPAVAMTEIVPGCGWWVGTISLVIIEEI